MVHGSGVPPTLRRRMGVVERHRDALSRLQDRWDQLALLGQMSGVATDVAATAVEFEALTGTMLEALAQRLLGNQRAQLEAHARITLEILVRNLFERTADVGFLAGDASLGEFLAAGEAREALRPALTARLRAYVRKYSVYDDIVVLDAEGAVLARLDAGVEVARSRHPLVADALRQDRPFTESFGPIDLLGGRRGLVYAAAIRPAGASRPLGVLCLSFRLDDELAGIFAKRLPPGEAAQVALLDADGTLLASSDPWQLPPGARLALPAAGRAVMRFAGREFLAVEAPPQSYQGYGGPAGWRMAALVPVDLAFGDAEDELDEGGHGAVAARAHDGVALEHLDMLGDDLLHVPQRARAIQRGLELAVWNGQLGARRDAERDASGGRFTGALLHRVADTGDRIRHVFEAAIGDLQRSAVSGIRREASTASSLAVDLMDRNLYERANDCRWWALDATLRRAADAPADAALARAAGAVLAHINGLYTVYDQLLLLDREGRVLAASRPRDDLPDAVPAASGWWRRTLGLRDDQGWARSDFEPTPFYRDRDTYVYAAAVQGEAGGVAGGVAIVFDGTPQFAAMLHDALPRDDGGRPLAQASALFVTRGGRVVASTDPAWVPGADAPPELGAALLAQLARGASFERLIERDGATFACAATMGGGYREYRSDDAMAADDVACVVLIRLGDARDPAAARELERFTGVPAAPGDGAVVDVATFLRDGTWYGLPVAQVEGAARIDRMAPLGAGGGSGCGLALHDGRAVSVIRLPVHASAASGRRDGPALVVMLRDRAGREFGLEVERLGGVLTLPAAAVQAMPSLKMLGDGLAEGLVRGATAGSPMLSVTSADRFAARDLPGAAAGLGPDLAAPAPDPLAGSGPAASTAQRRSQISANPSITTPISSQR